MCRTVNLFFSIHIFRPYWNLSSCMEKWMMLLIKFNPNPSKSQKSMNMHSFMHLNNILILPIETLLIKKKKFLSISYCSLQQPNFDALHWIEKKKESDAVAEMLHERVDKMNTTSDAVFPSFLHLVASPLVHLVICRTGTSYTASES